MIKFINLSVFIENPLTCAWQVLHLGGSLIIQFPTFSTSSIWGSHSVLSGAALCTVGCSAACPHLSTLAAMSPDIAR